MKKTPPIAGTKPSNPKDEIGITKLPLSLVPASALAIASLAHYDGKLKYGAWNWRHAGVKASVYMDACQRHLAAWQEGEEVASDSGVHHLGHALACLNIILDAQVHGKLIDDRPPSSEYKKLVEFLTPSVVALQSKNKGKHPRNYTIADTAECKA